MCPPSSGLKILSVYMSGSKNMSYDSASLTTPDIKWLGVRPSDLNKYKVGPGCLGSAYLARLLQLCPDHEHWCVSVADS